jgi:hypothetical protein
MHLAEARVQFSALIVALLKAGELDAAEALWEWGEEWLQIDREQLEEDLDVEDAPLS